MSEKKQEKITLKQLFFSEKLWTELVLFGILFAALFLQGWSDFLLPLFPLLFFFIAIFIRALVCGQEINYDRIIKPLSTAGIKDGLADRLEVTGILTLFTVLIQGYESLAHPQMAEMLAPFFLEILMVAYLVGYYTLFVGLQPPLERETVKESAPGVQKLNLIRLKVSSYSTILIGAIFGLGTLFNILTAFHLTPALIVDLPGSSLPNGIQILVNWSCIVVLIGGFTAAIINLYYLLANIQVTPPNLPLEMPFNDQKR